MTAALTFQTNIVQPDTIFYQDSMRCTSHIVTCNKHTQLLFLHSLKVPVVDQQKINQQ